MREKKLLLEKSSSEEFLCQWRAEMLNFWAHKQVYFCQVINLFSVRQLFYLGLVLLIKKGKPFSLRWPDCCLLFVAVVKSQKAKFEIAE